MSLNNIVSVHVMMYMFNQFNVKTEVVMFNRLILATQINYNRFRSIISNTKYEMNYEITILME